MCFIGYLHDDYKTQQLHIRLPKATTYVKRYYGQTKCIFDWILEEHNTNWDNVSADIKKEHGSEPVYNNSFLKNKIKSHGDEVTDFCDKEFPNVDSNHTCLAVISLNSALKKDGNYYPQVFLKECK